MYFGSWAVSPVKNKMLKFPKKFGGSPENYYLCIVKKKNEKKYKLIIQKVMTKESEKKLNEIIGFIRSNGYKETNVERYGKNCTLYTVEFKDYGGKVCVLNNGKQIGNSVNLELPLFASHHIFDSSISPLESIVVSYNDENDYPSVSFYGNEKDIPACNLFYDSILNRYSGISDDRIEQIHNILKNI